MAKNRVADHRYLLAFGPCNRHCRLCGRLFEIGFHQHVPSHPLEAKPPPSYHLGSARRPEKSHCTELLHTLYRLWMSLIHDLQNVCVCKYEKLGIALAFMNTSSELVLMNIYGEKT
jgi:hypothetical protein